MLKFINYAIFIFILNNYKFYQSNNYFIRKKT